MLGNPFRNLQHCCLAYLSSQGLSYQLTLENRCLNHTTPCTKHGGVLHHCDSSQLLNRKHCNADDKDALQHSANQLLKSGFEEKLCEQIKSAFSRREHSMEGWELVSYTSANQSATSPADLPQVKPGIHAQKLCYHQHPKRQDWP